MMAPAGSARTVGLGSRKSAALGLTAREETTMSDYGRIDVHQHLLPPDYVAWLEGKGIGDAGRRQLPAWSAEGALALMDRRAISTALLSVSTPGAHLGDDAEAATVVAKINDFSAELVKDRPDRFGFFATLTLPDVDSAVAEAARALGELGAAGVVLLANSRGHYLGDPAFDPLMTELDRRAAVVFVHPAELPGPAVEGIPPFAVDFLLDTTRAALNLVRRDVPRRFPGIRFVLAHGGGFLPYASHRIAAAVFAETGRNPREILGELSGFYFDTALASSPPSLASLSAFAGPERVLFGSDWPFAPEPAVAYFTGNLDHYDGFDEEQRRQIDHRTARRLFPGLAGG
jgi:predicted TIM-barrel fold metal-dependent hydrolase